MNIKHDAVKDSLRPGETPYERPDIVMRVWEEYTAELKKDLFKKGVLGKCEAWASSTKVEAPPTSISLCG
jgi:formylmethanofuran:tetrahydromethanopterin formyltransferase